MKKLLLIFLVLFCINLYAEPFWLNQGEDHKISFDENRIPSSLYIRWRDFGAESEVDLYVNNNIVKTLDAPKLQKIEFIELTNADFKNISIKNKKENVLIYDIGILYTDSTELENNMVKYHFSLPHYDNKNDVFELKNRIGSKFILLQFFQLHCIACQQKLPFLNQFDKQYNNTEIVLVNAGEQASDIDEYFIKEGLDTECIIDPDYEVCSQLEVYGVPHTIIFDKNGNILKRGNLSIEEIQLELDSVE